MCGIKITWAKGVCDGLVEAARQMLTNRYTRHLSLLPMDQMYLAVRHETRYLYPDYNEPAIKHLHVFTYKLHTW